MVQYGKYMYRNCLKWTKVLWRPKGDPKSPLNCPKLSNDAVNMGEPLIYLFSLLLDLVTCNADPPGQKFLSLVGGVSSHNT